MSVPGRSLRAGSNIKSSMGPIQPRVWRGSRAMLSHELYNGLQVGLFAMEYAERFAGFQLDSDAQDAFAYSMTFLWGFMGVAATSITAVAGIATGQWWYAGIALMAIPLQMDTLMKNFGAIAKRTRVRQYYERRAKIIAKGLQGGI